jgi:hypothetical protein
MQEGHPGVRALPRAEAEVEEHHPAVLAEGVGREDALLLRRLGARRMKLAIQEQVQDLEVAEISGAPDGELGLERGGDPARHALRHGPAEDLRVEAFHVADREPPDVGAANQGLQLGGPPGERGRQRERDGRGGLPHLRRAEVEGARLRLDRVMAVAIPVAGDRARCPFVVAPAEDGGDPILYPNLEQVLGGPPDKEPERVAGEARLEILGQRLPHLEARWYSLHGVGAPFSVRQDGSGLVTGRIPYAFLFLHRV